MFTTSRLDFLLPFIFISFLWELPATAAVPQIGIYSKFEQSFESDKEYVNPLYEVKKFRIKFTSPSGRVQHINGFWDGALTWKVRFAPDERGSWTWESTCSDQNNKGLHKIKGSFICVANKSRKVIYQRGPVTKSKGAYHLSYADGTPFFWAGCTAWNGTLKSTEQEWEQYLSHRAESGYSVIQFVTTQWRGGDKNSKGQVAFEGSGHIKINPEFFRHLDEKIDKINEHGLVAAPVLLWALGSVQGRELSPGYYLPDDEAILLARYMVARYGGNHVIWILGGDGKYIEENEQRWKNIGRGVFNDNPPGLVALHPGGSSWIGEVYAQEPWLDIVGYQSGHSKSSHTQDFINKGPMAAMWDKLPPRPIINMEPIYEEIFPDVKPDDVRKVGYWSLLNTPSAGFTYGANGIWPWLREGEEILNHASKGFGVSRWNESLELPGSVQIGYLANFMRSLDWWNLRPSLDLLAAQPGDKDPADFVAVAQSVDSKTIVVYFPNPATSVELYNVNNRQYESSWFNPVKNLKSKGKTYGKGGVMNIAPPSGESDYVLVLEEVSK